MKTILKHYIITLLLMTAFAFHAGADQKKLIVGTSASSPPFSFMDGDKLVGFDIDLINIIAKDLGYSLEIKDADFQSLLPGLKDKKFDILISAISPTQERMKSFDFSGRYYFPNYAIIHMTGKNISSENDLNDKIVGVVAGTSMESFLKNQFGPAKHIKIQSFPNMDFALDALKSGTIDAILDENGLAQVIDESSRQLTHFLITSARPDGYAIVFQKNSELMDDFNEEIVSLKVSKQLEDLQKKWRL